MELWSPKTVALGCEIFSMTINLLMKLVAVRQKDSKSMRIVVSCFSNHYVFDFNLTITIGF